MIKPHGRLVSSRLTRQSHPDCRATVDGTLGSDWTGERFTKQQAKNYIRDYKMSLNDIV